MFVLIKKYNTVVGHYWYNVNTNFNKKKFFEAIKHYKYIPL